MGFISTSVANLNRVLLQLRPTTGRVPIPPECADGTIAVCVTGSSNKKGSSVLCSSRTKSAGKNKFQLNWFQVKKDELTAPSGKSAVKLPEEQEPSVVLCDQGTREEFTSSATIM